MIRLIQLNYTCKARNKTDKKDDMLFRGVSSFFCAVHTTKWFRALVMRNYSSEAVFLRYAPGVT